MTKSTWSPQHQRWITEGRQRPEFISPKLPGGKNVAEVHSSELITILTDAEVPGVSCSNARGANLDAYQRHLDEIGNAAAETAVNAWLKSKSKEQA